MRADAGIAAQRQGAKVVRLDKDGRDDADFCEEKQLLRCICGLTSVVGGSLEDGEGEMCEGDVVLLQLTRARVVSFVEQRHHHGNHGSACRLKRRSLFGSRRYAKPYLFARSSVFTHHELIRVNMATRHAAGPLRTGSTESQHSTVLR